MSRIPFRSKLLSAVGLTALSFLAYASPSILASVPEPLSAEDAQWWEQQGYQRCEVETLRRLRGKPLLDYIEKVPGKCLSPLFRPGVESREIFSAETMRLAAERAQQKAQSWQGKKHSGLWPLAVFLKAGYFIRGTFPEAQLEPFPADLDQRVMHVVDTLLNNDTLWSPQTAYTSSIADSYSPYKDGQDTVYETLLLADSVRQPQYLMAAVEAFFNRYRRAHKMSWAQHAFFPMFKALYALHQDPHFRQRVAQGGASRLISNLLRVLKEGKSAFADEAVYRSMLVETSRFVQYKPETPHDARASGQGSSAEALAKAMADIEEIAAAGYRHSRRMSPDWAAAIYALTKAAKLPCERYSLCTKQQEIQGELFPYHWQFDDGQLVVKTSLPYEKVLPIYHSLKQVKAQFLQQTGVASPVADDHNDSLTLVVYEHQKDYQTFQELLYDLSPHDNAGVYLEEKGTIYASQLDDRLLRHEYVHYLVGRYLVPGSWESSRFYQEKKDRMVWFEEGIAEFFAGSTSRHGVKVMPEMVQSWQSEYPAFPRSPAYIMKSSREADGSTLYWHSALWISYLHQHQPEQLQKLFQHIREGSVAKFDQWVTDIGKGGGHDDPYKSFLQGQRLQWKAGTLWYQTQPATRWPGQWDEPEVKTIQNELGRLLQLPLQCELKPEGPKNLQHRFECHGWLSLTANEPIRAKQEGARLLNRSWTALERTVNNFVATHCSVGDYQLDRRVAAVRCEGPLSSNLPSSQRIEYAKAHAAPRRPLRAAATASPFADVARARPAQSTEQRDTIGSYRYHSTSRCLDQSLGLADGERAELTQSPRLGRLVLERNGNFRYRNDQSAPSTGADTFSARIYTNGGVALRDMRVVLKASVVDMDERRCWELGR